MTNDDPRTTAAMPANPLAYLGQDRPMVAGVARRFSSQFGIHRVLVRMAFVVLILAAGAGVVIYGGLWLLTFGRADPEPRPTSARNDVALLVFAAAGLTFALTLVDGLPDVVLWLVSTTVLGLTISSLPTDEDQSRSKLAESVFGVRRIHTAIGVLLVIGSVGIGLASTQGIGQFFQSSIAIVVLLGGLTLVLAPWLSQLTHTAESERLERIRAEERADIAAHLHDSVLQTLTLIQNRAAEPKVAAALAHQQERELRSWLYGADRPNDNTEVTMRSSIESVCAELEDQYLVTIETITIGDHPLTDEGRAVIAAMREALVNAAKFSDSQIISVFAELEASGIAVFVRDRGIGFDPDAVPEDRRGIRESIVERLEKMGGQASLRTAPGEGTEVALSLRFDQNDRTHRSTPSSSK